MKFTFKILLIVGLIFSVNEISSQTEAKSLTSDITWGMGQSHKQKINDISDFDVTAGKIYRLTFYGVYKNDITQNQGFIAEWILSSGADGNFAGISFGQHNPTNWLGEMWTLNSDALYRRIETDKTIDTSSKHSIKLECLFTCTSTGKIDLYFGGLLGFNAKLFAGSGVIVEEY